MAVIPPCCGVFCCTGPFRFQGKALQLRGYNEVYSNPLRTGKHTPPLLSHSVHWLQFPLCESPLTKETRRYCCCIFLSFSDSHEMNQQGLRLSHRSFLPSKQLSSYWKRAGWLGGSIICLKLYCLGSKASRYFFKPCSNHLMFDLKQVISPIFALVPCLCRSDNIIFHSWCPWLKIATSTNI